MTVSTPMDEDQSKLWNGPAARAWVDAQALLDRVLEPMENLLVEAVFAAGPDRMDRVLDVGCGTGGTTVAAARRLRRAGCCIGIDISEPMIAAARARRTGTERVSELHLR